MHQMQVSSFYEFIGVSTTPSSDIFTIFFSILYSVHSYAPEKEHISLMDKQLHQVLLQFTINR